MKKPRLSNKRLVGIVLVLAIAAVGVLAMVISNAATPFMSLEPESGILTGGATAVSDTTASGSSAVRFSVQTGGNTPGIYVQGNKLVNGLGEEVILHGVNKMGSEYACIDGWGLFDGPIDQASINAMKTWNINAVRITMNSVCWNNGPQNQFNTYNAAYAGTNYKNAIKSYVDLLVQNGIHPVLDLQWAGCGNATCKANGIKTMPDRPGAVNFWSDVAATFKDNKSVIFDLYNEPTNPTWTCWRDGGCTIGSGAGAFTAAGMQEMLTAVRSAGATTQPILVGGISYSNDVSQWLQFKPNDPSKSIVTSIHLYNFNYPCPGTGGSGAAAATAGINCFSSGSNNLTTILATNPVIFGELGANDCSSAFVTPMMDWMVTKKISVLGWAWFTGDCAGIPSLLTNYNGTASGLGSAFKTHYTTKYPAWAGIK